MKVKEAIAQAKALVEDFHADEEITGVRLEEVEFDEPSDSWLITLGIMRPALVRKSDIVTKTLAQDALTRTYKVMRIPNKPSSTPSMKIRELLTGE